MPAVAYQYLSLNNIGWPTPALPAPPGATTCVLPPVSGLPLLGTPLVPTVPNLVNSAQVIGAFPGPAAVNLIEMQWRVLALEAAAEVDLAGNLVATPLIGAVDPSEQATLSYHMGSVATAYIGTVVAPTINFMHLGRFNAAFPGWVNYLTPQRPDFISFTLGLAPQILIWEAKGRVGGAVPGVMRVGFGQARAINTVAGVGVGAYLCCLCRGTVGGPWTISVTDPSIESDGINDPTFLGQIYAEYYRPFAGIIASSRSPQAVSFAGQTFTSVPIPGTDTQLGLDQRIVTQLQSYTSGQTSAAKLASGIGSLLLAGYGSQKDSTQYVNPNGLYTAVGTSWFSSPT